MRIGVWGAGEVGRGVAYRLIASPACSELAWINQHREKIAHRVVDLEHGLAFVPACGRVRAYSQEQAISQLPMIDVLILTIGKRVPRGGSRAELLGTNWNMLQDSVLPVLDRSKYRGIVLVVTNPVDQLCCLLQRGSRLEPNRVLGLGTVVETARLRASLGSRLSPPRPARDVWSYAVGTHDEHFIPVIDGAVALGATLSPEELSDIEDDVKLEVAQGAARVKQDDHSTMLPVVEGVMRIVEALGSRAATVLTVSVREEAPEGLWYSVPTEITCDGAGHRHLQALSRVQPKLAETRKRLIAELATISPRPALHAGRRKATRAGRA